MDVSEARKVMYDLTKFYFQNAVVAYAKQSFRVKPTMPLVTLSFGNVNRPMNPPVKWIDGRPVSLYPCTMMVQIDLFTKGKQIDVAGSTSVMENTAANDMLKFADFLNADYAIAYCHEHDIAIVLTSAVQDLTDILNDTNYEYRAMIEVELRFTSYSIGYSGSLTADSIKHIDPITGEYIPDGDAQDENAEIVPETEITVSGGGNNAVLEGENSYFTNVRVNDKQMKEETDL